MRTWILACVLLLQSLATRADEGMWLPHLLGKQVYADMVKKGLKLTPEQLYSINKASLKDAIVLFNGGCTGEIVSAQGLLFTNHHCGYDAIAAASSVQNNYLKDGFWAKDKGQEIPSQGLYVEFLVRIEDITQEVMDSLKGLNGPERLRKQSSVLAAINSRLSDPAQFIQARVSALFKGNQYLAFVYQRYNDVRLVGTPPESIGKFGGDTDNWEWPRHTGDFSVFRVYMSKDGKPSNYDAGNIPLKAKYFLPISLKGFRDGDFAMIFGYPGSTNRYETSLGVKQKTEIDNPAIVELRDIRLKAMFNEMKKDPAVKLRLASDYAGIANYWKFYDGERKQLLKYYVFEQKQKEETSFLKWAAGKADYANLFSSWQQAYDKWKPYSRHRIYINEGILGSPVAAFASSLIQVERALVTRDFRPDQVKQILQDANSRRDEFLKSEDRSSDQQIIALIAQKFYEDIDKAQHPIGFYEGIKGNFGDLKDPGTYQAWARQLINNTFIFDDTRWKQFMEKPDAVALQNDPAFAYASAFVKNWNSKFAQHFTTFNTVNLENGRLYIKGILESNPTRKMYPDATLTMRVSYGQVKSYKPRDAVNYDYVCTMKGVLEKHKPGDYEFDLPASLLQAAAKKDYGQYIDKSRNDLVVAFITTNDITGGNSGSPVLNANGELLGLAFDGNYEALSHKIAFDKDLNRTICVDIRYVLWCMDKLGGASHLIQELKLVRQ